MMELKTAAKYTLIITITITRESQEVMLKPKRLHIRSLFSCLSAKTGKNIQLLMHLILIILFIRPALSISVLLISMSNITYNITGYI